MLNERVERIFRQLFDRRSTRRRSRPYTAGLAEVLESRQLLSGSAIIVDNSDASFNQVGAWSAVSGGGYNGSYSAVANTSSGSVASWNFTGLATGQYFVQATWTPDPDRATNAAIFGNTEFGNRTTVNQRIAPTADFQIGNTKFQTLMVVTVANGKLSVELSNPAADGTVIADAIRIQKVDASDNSVAVRTERLRQIVFAMYNFEQSYGQYPPDHVSNFFDANNQSNLSWRVYLLPYLGYDDLFQQFHLDEAWNSEHNLALLDRMPDVFRSRDLPVGSTLTGFQRINSSDAYQIDGSNGPRIQSATDGIGTTLLLLETSSDQAVPWTAPNDAPYSSTQPLNVIGQKPIDFTLVAMVDGSIHQLSPNVSADDFSALVTWKGGEVISNATESTAFVDLPQDVDRVSQNKLRHLQLGFFNREAETSYFFVRANYSVDDRFDANGNPNLSWRVYLLPYLGYQNLFKQFHLDETWDSPHNLPLANQMPEIFRSRGISPGSNLTSFKVFSGPAASQLNSSNNSRNFSLIDGASNTISIIELPASSAVVWTRPDGDIQFNTANPMAGVGPIPDEGLWVSMFDGTVHHVSSQATTANFGAFVTWGGGEALGPFDTANVFPDWVEPDTVQNRTYKLMELGWAFSYYESTYSALPVTSGNTSYDASGRPNLSWRVFLLPFLGQQALFNQFHLDEAWDSPNNFPLLAKMPEVFRSRGILNGSELTGFQILAGSSAYNQPLATRDGGWGHRSYRIADGTGNTILVVETPASQAVEWTRPDRDIQFDPAHPLAGLSTSGLQNLPADGILTLMADGSVRNMRPTISASNFLALATWQGGEVLGPDDLAQSFFYTALPIDSDPRWWRAREDRLKELMLAFWDYESTFQSFPIGSDYWTSVFDDAGKPKLSWRVYLLPYLGESALFKQFHLDEAWDSPNNLPLLAKMPEVFRSRGLSMGTDLTGFQFISAPQAYNPNSTHRQRVSSVADGTSVTIGIIEVPAELAVPWTKPDDFSFDPEDPLASLRPYISDAVMVGMIDGAVRSINPKIDPASASALMTWAGNDRASDIYHGSPSMTAEMRVFRPSSIQGQSQLFLNVKDVDSFGTTVIGNPIVHTIDVENTGSQTLTISSVQLPAGYTLMTPLAPILPGQQFELKIRLDANATGTFTGVVTLSTDAPNQRTLSFTLKGIVSSTSLVPTINVAVATSAYSNRAHLVTDASVTGANQQTIATFGDPALSYTYYAGSLTAAQIATAIPLSSPPVNAGDYTVVATFTSQVAGYLNAIGSPVHFSITKAALTISAESTTKQYDGTTDANALPTKIVGLQGADSVTNLWEEFASKNVNGINQSQLNVLPGYVINDGNGGNNYTVTLVSAFGTITPAALTIRAVYDSKVYDGTTQSSQVPRVRGLFDVDSVSDLRQEFSSKDMLGENLSVVSPLTPTISDGNGGRNYVVTLSATSASITPARLTIGAVTAGKVYDGTTDSSIRPTIDGLSGSDIIRGLSQAYVSKDVLGQNASLLYVTNYTIDDGNDGKNYSVTLSTAPGTISPASLVISAASYSKSYDGTLRASAVPMVSGLMGSDRVTGLSEEYSSKNVLGANGSTLNVTAYTIVDGSGGQNYSVTLKTATGTVTPALLTISAVTSSKVYDGTASSTAIPTVVGLIGVDTITGLSEAYASKNVLGVNASTLNVSAYTVNDGNNGHNYLATLRTAVGIITPATLTISAVANSKVYDGTTKSTTSPMVVGLLGADTVTGLLQAYTSKNVQGVNGSTLYVTALTWNDGNNGHNYSATLKTATGTITPAALTISAVTSSKVYDGTTSSTSSPTVAGLLSTDSVTGMSEAYASKNVLGANGSTLNVAAYKVNDGNYGHNYLVRLKAAAGTITPTALVISAVASAKVYDGTTNSAAAPTAAGLRAADTVTGLLEAYSSKNVLGVNGSTLNVTAFTVNDGNNGRNYSVTLKAASGIITPAALTISAVASTKVYDGTTKSTATPTVAGLLGTDRVTGLVQAYTSRNVLGVNGSTLYVTALTWNDGNNGGNYSATLKTATGTITPAALRISAAASTKVYDGTTNSTAAPTVAGLLGADSVTGMLQAYVSKNVLGFNGSILNVTAYKVNDGNNGRNYSAILKAASGIIPPAALTISAVATAKVYDGTTTSTATPSVAGLLGTDKVTGLVQTYTSKNVLGANVSMLYVTALTWNDGNNGHNYSATLKTASGTITPAALTIAATASTKVYDGTTSSIASPTVGGLLGTDSVTKMSQAYASKNALGTNGSALKVTAYAVNDGNNGLNYTVSLKTAVGTVTPAALVISAVVSTKLYDGTTTSAATPTVAGLRAADTVTGLLETYASKNVLGLNGSTLKVTSYTVNDGNNSKNYSVTLKSAAGTITPTALTISAVAGTKVYDGTTNSTATPTFAGRLGTDTVTGLLQTYTSKNVLGLNGSTLNVTAYTVNDGNNGRNYSTILKAAMGTITPATLRISATASTKVYDGTTNSTAIPTVVGLLGADSVTGLLQAYVSKNVLGFNGSTLNVTAYTVNDGNSGQNYSVILKAASGIITPAALTISAVSSTKVYDGTTTSIATPTVVGLLGTDTVTGLVQAYLSKNVMGADGSTLKVTALTWNDGNNGHNYTATLNTATGTITPAALTISAVVSTKVYDGTTNSTVSPTVTGLLVADTVTGLIEAYSSRDVLGTSLSTLQVTGYKLNDGANGNNYVVTLKTAAGTITPASLIISATTNAKSYDGTTTAAAIPTVAGLNGSDSVTNLVEEYLSPAILGPGKSTLKVTGYKVNDGALGKNYAVTLKTAAGTIQ